MANIAVAGNNTSHGGVLLGTTVTVIAGGRSISVLGELVPCPIGSPPHGTTPITTASSTVFAEGIAVARAGDMVGCGASILTGYYAVRVGG
jgi:uncharacterized Zn-binding protein involved in type VI secretion